MAMELRRKLEILADAAKYDASCASSGTEKRDSRPGDGKPGGLGSTEGMGICHAYAPDGALHLAPQGAADQCLHL
jgi:predicted DNA-binding helix-hairpin-helix protein